MNNQIDWVSHGIGIYVSSSFWCDMKKIEVNTIESTPEKTLLPVDEGWRLIIEPITLFKDAVDRVRDAEGKKTTIRSEDRKILAAHNVDANALREIDKARSGSLTGPMNFVQLVLGPFIGEYGSTIGQIRIPSWSALGWQFKYLNESALTEESAFKFLMQTIEPSLPRATATCFGGIPLFVSGEGKNRGSFHRRYEFNQLVEIRTGSYPDAHELRLQSVAFVCDFVALHCFQGRQKTTALLPLPKLSVPLLEAYGVQWIPSPWFGLFLPWIDVLIDSGDKWWVGYRERLAVAWGSSSLRHRFFIEKG